jgi:hypothetical protein
MRKGARNVHCTSANEIEAFIRSNPSNLYWANVQELDPSTLPQNAPASDDNIKRFRQCVIEFDPQRRRPEDAADFDAEFLRKPLSKAETRKRRSDAPELETPQRGDCAATDAEKGRTVAAARNAYAYIKKEYGVLCSVFDSGNGTYLYVPVDLQNTAENRELVAAATNAFKRLFSAPGVEVDTTAKNPSRVLGIPGTLNAKGANTAARPHRMRKLLVAGSRNVLFTAEQLAHLANVSPEPKSRPSSGASAEKERGPFTYRNVENMLQKLDDRSEKFTFTRTIKTPDANWKVVWHQDRTIAVRERKEVAEFGPWSIKAGVQHVQPPASLMSTMIAIRLHLDESRESNGPLRVIPGSHRAGYLSNADIDNWRGRSSVTCTVPRGGAKLMRPLLLHASSSSSKPEPRRVIHLEFAADDLPGGLEWHDRV